MSTCPNCGYKADDSFKFCPSCGTRALEAGVSSEGMLGRTLNEKYRVEEQIGQGSMGTVYLAEHIGLRKKVALKVLHPELQVGDDALVRFQREGIAAGKFSHPNAIQIFDFDKEGSQIFYLAMEYVDGQSLKPFIRENAPVPAGEAVAIVRQILLALSEAHVHGIVHRDLKPDNVMLQVSADGELAVKVLDFGLSKLVDRGAGASLATQTGMILGTPLYMSPEQCAGDPADARSDLYATGLILYELLAGELPFRGSAVSEILLERASTPARAIAELRPDLGIPADLDAVLRAALQHDRKQRYQSAREMVEAIDAADLGGPAAVARSPEATAATVVLGSDGRVTPARSRGGAGRSRTLWIVAAVAVVLGALALLKVIPGGLFGGDVAYARVSLKPPEERTEQEVRYVALLDRARGELRSRQPQDALTSVESALQLPCTDAEGLYVRGLVFRVRKDYDTARIDFDEAARIDPTYAAPVCGRGWVAFDRGDLDAAFAWFDEALGRDARSADALTGKGAVLWRRGELTAAHGLLSEAVGIAGDSSQALYYLGRVQLDEGNADEAIGLLVRSKRGDARNFETLAALGEAYARAGRPEEAEPQLRAALAESRDAITALESLVTLLIAHERYGEALSALEETIGRRDDVASLHVLQALALRGQGKGDESIASLERACERQGVDLEAHLLLGILYHQHGRLDDAAAQYRVVLDDDDSVVQAHLNLGFIHRDQGRPEDAVAALERAVGRDPDVSEGHRQLGILYMDWVIDHDVAADHFRRYLELEGNDSEVRGWLRSMGRKP